MSGGAGHIYDMIKRLKGNHGLLNKSRRQKVKEAYQKVLVKKQLSFKKATPDELIRIRQIVKIEKRKEAIRSALAIAITILLIPLIIFSLITAIKLFMD